MAARPTYALSSNMFGPLGLPELLFILGLALLIFGPKRLPEVGRTLGKGLAEFRKASTELRRSINTELMVDEIRDSDPRRLLRDDGDAGHSRRPPGLPEPADAAPASAPAPPSLAVVAPAAERVTRAGLARPEAEESGDGVAPPRPDDRSGDGGAGSDS